MKTAEEMVELALPSVLEGLKAEIKATIDWQIKQDAGKLVSDHVTEYIKENVLPEISLQLIESKDGLIALGATLGPALVEAMTASLLEKFKENLQGYRRTQIFEAMFK
jgi:hypothetical protein